MVYNTVRPTLVAVALMLLLGGCSSSSYFDTDPDIAGPVAVSVRQDPDLVRVLPMYSGAGESLGWQDLIDACRWAEVVVIGELHDDAAGHAVQLAVVRDMLAGHKTSTAVALEMLERDEQLLVADYENDIIDAKQFAQLTFSSAWAGDGSWEQWYQPIIDAALARGAPVIAANAPRRYVQLARTDGFDRLRAIPQPRRALFDLPTSLRTGAYRERFFDVMREMGRHGNSHDDAAKPVPAPQIEAMFRAQMVWDATMAQSVVSELREKSDRVILLVGQFHSDFNGGTVQEIRRRSPTSRILTISMQQRGTKLFHEEDRDRADIVIYTGQRPADNGADSADDEADVSAADDEPDPVTASPHDTPHAQPHPPAPAPSPPTPPSAPKPPSTLPDSG